MVKETQEAITVKKSEDFSEWYQQVVQKAELADYSTVKGCMIIRPNAYYIWQQIQDYFNKRLKSLKVKNAYFPLFIPEKFFQKEAEHAQGFKPEVAWIANTEEGDRLAIRPTSETVIYDSYSKWIRSHKDLPLRINQWANIVRWETKATRLFIRTREFLWQEGHCVYETEECNGHNLGETYLSKDGCNTCQCTIDGSGNIRELCTERSCEPIEEKECPQLGYREKGRYCNINYAWEEQRNGGEYCNNDFECSSNSCLDSQCTEPGFWTKLSKWLAKFLVNPN